MVNEILEILNEDSRRTPEEIAVMLGVDVETVKQKIAELERNKVIVKYNTIVNWDKTDREYVTALIEVKVTPQRDQGFDAIAERIYKFPEVKSVFLMSGDYDLAVMIEGRTMKEVAFFVAEKLSVLDSVLSTATHFVLKKYKVDGVILEDGEKDYRQVIVP
ncbi:DNA-binding Lrp family transcriptional regulator [Caldicoprobacter guelmensis]|uniref:Lrp/AsnC family transcriptional regulator n=1 Tax=Caldicoprobacter guelmensis TaxID=1170224 RepID=UPI0019587DAF|nr:Lrp/AsnC family transcriptional regulator [Caldicoprobacter guelmensis]MBM7582358.1 DNA-binding Lrp family transcriptional regulator [Caldicoprobacter guelmensis]